MATNIVLGTAPDSWGIWFADDPQQTPAQRFLDEVVEAGYEWIEIGAFGYLSTDPAQLRDDLAARQPEGLRRHNLRPTAAPEHHRRGLVSRSPPSPP